MRKERPGGRRAIAGVAGAVGLAALVAVVLLASSAGGSNKSYTVRAIFDDAANIIPGENVDVAAVKVGTVKSVEPTPTAKAAVVLSIGNPGFQNFLSDATCTIRPQGLIGEKYVDCVPTQPRPEGSKPPPPLKQIPSGHEGAGQYYLPVTNTHSPVDPDLLNDINRLPERQRFTIIINELGAGLLGRGSDLSAVIRRANPALQELDNVLKILAGENTVLEELAVNSDKALKPFAAVREHVAKFIAESEKTAVASANTRASLARNLELFPKFLEELVPAVERLGKFAEATTPTMQALGAAAPGINQTFTSIPGFSASSEKFFKSTGQTAKLSGPALVATKPLLARLKKLGTRGPAGVLEPRRPVRRLPQHRWPRAPARLHLPRHRRRQRLRLARPLPAHRGPRHDLHRIQDRVHELLQPQAVLDRERDGNGRVGNGVGSGLGVERLGGHRTGHPGARDGAHAGGHQRRYARTGDRRIPR